MVELKEKLRTLGNLPALPATVVRLLQALGVGDTDSGDLEEIVRCDEAVSAAVLRMANSAAMGSSGRSFTLQESITRLGTRNLQRIAVSLNAGRMMNGRGMGYGMHRGELWQGSLGGAIAADLIALDTGLEDPSLCFVTALLRDIGKMAMECLFEDEDLERVFGGCEEGCTQMDIERRELGVDHAELGAMLAEIWRLPPRLIEGIRRHHEPVQEGAEQDCLVDVVHCADSVCLRMGIGLGADGLRYPLDERAAEVCGLSGEDLEGYMAEVKVQLDRLLMELADECE